MPRNRVRHRLLPALEREEPGLAARLARLADRARRAGAALDRRLAGLLAGGGRWRRPRGRPRRPSKRCRRSSAPSPCPGSTGGRGRLIRRAPRRVPSCCASSAARGGRPAIAAAAGAGRRAASLLILRRAPRARETAADFTYTLQIPGELDIPEVSVRMRVSRRAVEPWMFEGSAHRAGLALPLTEGDRVTIRNRRPGDRIHPLGADGSRRLKDVLIDRRVPRAERDRLPLLCVGERIAWVPGVTIEERFRLAGDATAWVAEVSKT